MQVRSKNGKRTVKLAADERRALTKASVILTDLSELASGELQRSASKALGALAEAMLDTNPESQAEYEAAEAE